MPPKKMRFRINSAVIEIEYVRCRNTGCNAIIMLVVDPGGSDKEYAWIHVLFPGESTACKNPLPPRELNGC